jgi:molybdopterin converting factor small subunit
VKVRVKLTEPIWRTVGSRDLEVEMPAEEATVGAVLDDIARRFSGFGDEIYSGSSAGDYYYGLFLNDKMVGLAQRDDVVAKDGDEIFVLLPITGGCW